MTAAEKVVVWGEDQAPVAEAWENITGSGDWRWRCLEHGNTVTGLPSLAVAMVEMAGHIANHDRRGVPCVNCTGTGEDALGDNCELCDGTGVQVREFDGTAVKP